MLTSPPPLARCRRGLHLLDLGAVESGPARIWLGAHHRCSRVQMLADPFRARIIAARVDAPPDLLRKSGSATEIEIGVSIFVPRRSHLRERKGAKN